MSGEEEMKAEENAEEISKVVKEKKEEEQKQKEVDGRVQERPAE